MSHIVGLQYDTESDLEYWTTILNCFGVCHKLCVSTKVSLELIVLTLISWDPWRAF